MKSSYFFLSSFKVYNGIDLLNLKAPPKEPTRYATKVVGVLFTKEELLTGMVPPVNEKYGRTAPDSEKILLLKSKYYQ